ncbi:MAG: hypothetical protein KH135_05565 [Firmicutes bacterium]|nr:hypothetical protein [Bacillota bacterium]
MNEMTNLQKLDFACIHTWNKYHSKRQVSGAILKAILESDYQSFTSTNGARAIIREVSPMEIEAELLKNIVKTSFYKEQTNDFEYTGRALFDFDTNLEQVPTEYIENGLSNVLQSSNDTYQMERGQIGFEYLNDPVLLKQVIESFVHNRYERNLREQIDAVAMNQQVILDDIDAYTMRYQNGFTNRSK